MTTGTYPLLELPAKKTEVQLLRAELAELRREVNVLSSMVALFWHPARDQWERHTAPVLDGDSDEMPTLRLPRAPDPQVLRVTIDDSPVQMVRAYGHENRLIHKYCGPFKVVGLKLLAVTGGLLWEQIEAPPRTPVVFPITPIPEVLESAH